VVCRLSVCRLSFLTLVCFAQNRSTKLWDPTTHRVRWRVCVLTLGKGKIKKDRPS